MPLPYAAEAELEITIEELEYLEAKYNSEKEEGAVSPDTIFIYAWGLIRSKYTDDKKLGVSLFNELMKCWPDRTRECYYYLALAYFRLGEYKRAKQYIEDLLVIEPENKQALSLKDEIESKVMRDGVIGLALVGGVVAAAAGLLYATTRKRNP